MLRSGASHIVYWYVMEKSLAGEPQHRVSSCWQDKPVANETCMRETSGWSLCCQVDSDLSCGKGSAAVTGGATGSWQSHEDVPSRWKERGLACSVPQLGQPAALYRAEWVYGSLTVWLKLNLHLLPWRGTGLLCLPSLLLASAPTAAPGPEVPPSQP